MPDQERLFCSKPFEWFEVTQLNGRGGTYLCCPSWLPTSVGNLRHQSVAEIWNGETARRIRRSVLDGTFDYCDRGKCPYLQTKSGPVTSAAAVDGPLKGVVQAGLTELPYGPKKIICTYDQSCNLSCPTCRTAVIVEREHEREILAIQDKLEKEALTDADYLLITGSGDPFGSPYFRRWLQGMRRADMPRLDWIHLHSNAVLWTPRMWGTIPGEIRELIKSAQISIDAASADTYAVNRRGGDFGKLLKNLEFIGRLRREGPLRDVHISMVVQENNFAEMPAFVELCRRFGFDRTYFGQLVNWGTFSEAEFAARAVHFADHPRHDELVRLLQDPVFDAPVVDLGNLTAARNGEAPRYSAPVVPLHKRLWRTLQGPLLKRGMQ